MSSREGREACFAKATLAEGAEVGRWEIGNSNFGFWISDFGKNLSDLSVSAVRQGFRNLVISDGGNWVAGSW